MPRDHYVSQVHLRNFYSPALSQRMYAIRKKDLHCFTARSEEVCRIPEGSTNNYLETPRIIEEFLRDIEPRYNASVDAFRNRRVNRDSIYVISGFITYVASCSPTAMRLGQSRIRTAAETSMLVLDDEGLLPKLPASTKDWTFSELLANDYVGVEVDEKYSQAHGISGFIEKLGLLGNLEWDVIFGANGCSPFFTSDYPSAIHRSKNGDFWRIAPLAPDIAVRVKSSRKLNKSSDLEFPQFRCKFVDANHQLTRELNEVIVRCAESLVFYRDDDYWVRPFVKRNAAYRIDIEVSRGLHDGQYALAHRQVVGKFNELTPASS